MIGKPIVVQWKPGPANWPYFRVLDACQDGTVCLQGMDYPDPDDGVYLDGPWRAMLGAIENYTVLE